MLSISSALLKPEPSPNTPSGHNYLIESARPQQMDEHLLRTRLVKGVG